jgi:uncharacterized protein YjiS (DUF1127 family)
MIMSYAAHRRDFGSFADNAPSKTETAPSADRHLSRGSLRENLDRRTGARNLATALDVELERQCEPIRREEVPMTGRSDIALPGPLFEYHTVQRAKLPPTIASPLAELLSAWRRHMGRRRLARSIAHLDERLLADIGLGPEDLGFAERVARRRATGVGIWAGSKTGPGTDWQ